MTPLHMLMFVTLATFATTTWGQAIIQVDDNSSHFEVDIDCDVGTTRVALIEPDSGVYLDIGTIGRRGAQVEPTTTLLRSDTRSKIGRAVLAGEGLLEADTDAGGYLDVSSCLGVSRPASTDRAVDCHGGTCICQSDENTDCDLFIKICEATGGQSGHNICTW